MRYRRFGNSDLEVSEVGFGTWTLASDWWGVVEDKQGMLHAALDAGINFIDTAPVYGNDGIGETLLADVLKTNRDEIVLTTKCGYDNDAARMFPGQSERPQDWDPSSIRAPARGIAAPARHRLRRPVPAAQRPHRADPRRRALGGARALRDGGQGPRARRRARPRDRLGRRGARVDPAPRRSRRCRPSSTSSSRSPGSPSPRRSATQGKGIGLISRVPHASDTLSGKVTRDTVFPPEDHRSHRNRDNMLDNFDKADTLAFLWEGTGRTRGRPRSRASSPTRRSPRCCPRTWTSTTCGSTRPPPRCRSPRTRSPGSTSCGRENFGVENRYEMPLKRATRRLLPVRPRRWAEGEVRPSSVRPMSMRLPAEQRRTQLLSVAVEVFGERGFHATSMDEVAEAAGVTKPVLYQHFPSKRALYRELLDDVDAQLVAQLVDATAGAASGRERVQEGFAAYFRFVAENRAAFRLLFGASVRNDAEFAVVAERAIDRIADSDRRPHRDRRPSRAPSRARPRDRRHGGSHEPAPDERRRRGRPRPARRMAGRDGLVRAARRPGRRAGRAALATVVAAGVRLR